MAYEEITIREGTTSSIIMQLLNDGSAIDLTDVDHVRLDMLDSKNKTYRYSSDDSPAYISITDAINGKVTFSPPSSTTFLYGKTPYHVYVWVYPTSITRYSVPEDNKYLAKINVLKEY